MIVVSNPHGTVGLADLGVPELHMWARPADGLDPGLDLKLSMNDVGYVLNQQAERLLEGHLCQGSTFSVGLDGGLATAHFTVGVLCEPDDLDAFRVIPGAHVIPLHWELHREPAGSAVPVSRAVSEQIAESTEHWLGIVDDLGGSPVPGAAKPEPNLGPWTPVIQAVRRSVELIAKPDYLQPYLTELASCSARTGRAVVGARVSGQRQRLYSVSI